jgi:hypothetical protein
MKCETVKVQRGESYVIINKSDFIDGADKVYEEKQLKLDNVSKPEKAPKTKKVKAK